MKPVRGSNRASSQAPSRNKSRKKAQVKSNEGQEQSDDSPIHSKPPQKRKAEGGQRSVPKEVKGQDKWKVLPPSSICAMENIMDLSILTTLTMKRKDKVSQEHLNLLKNRFLAHCTQLKAPVQKHARLVYSSQQHREETRKLAAGKLTLRSLKEDVKAVVRVLENVEEQTASLEKTCRLLRDELEEEEKKAAQTHLRKIIPVSQHKTTARRLGKILQKPEASEEEQVLLRQAHKHAQLLFKTLHSNEPWSEGGNDDASLGRCCVFCGAHLC
ncbi:centromere protein Q isoform X2 [Nothobranchius furzeri]|uniref:centromere protein Q isoform X2 n=1 Tax=Nothobranchius furzeri TaxID=105023 RepID=UPI002403E9F8|nr:centromere protein Q isoform X2 [Nothobranchius furzeri]